LRLPDTLAKEGKYLVLAGLQFVYGQENILAALASGTALGYRFVRDQKSWRVFVSTSVKAPELNSNKALGAIGIDVNSDHLALAEVDRFGNYVRGHKIACVTFSKTSDQTKSQIGEAVKQIFQLALKTSKPVVIEKLDFTQKKAGLETSDPSRARQLSSFAYFQTSKAIHSTGFKQGVEVLEVNPAFTSVIGAVNYCQKLGISIHLAAALAIARRGMGLSERPAVRMGVVPVRNGGHVTLVLPVRNRTRHVWSFWSATRTRLKAAQRVHVRSGEAKANPAPLLPLRRVESADWALPVKSRQANRLHNGSVGVVSEDLV
jgi:IS605 OrfB family transposase